MEWLLINPSETDRESVIVRRQSEPHFPLGGPRTKSFQDSSDLQVVINCFYSKKYDILQPALMLDQLKTTLDD
jgi:hypothetical protein